MPKAHRGSEVRKLLNRSRGTCPVCSRTGIKLLYKRELTEGTQTSICKQCNSKISKA